MIAEKTASKQFTSMSDSLKDKVFSEQVRLLYRGKVRTVSLNYIALLLVGILMYDDVPALPLIVWMSLIFMVTTIRLKRAFRHAPYDEPLREPARKFRKLVIGTAIQGVVWALGLVFFIHLLPLVDLAMFFILFTVAIAFCMVSYSASRLMFFLFTGTATLIPVLSVIIAGEGVQVVLASLMLIVFILLSTAYSWNYNRLAKGLTLRFENEDLMDSLVESNRKLEQTNYELHSLKQQLTTVSLTDELTGIPNRRYFKTQISNEWQRAMRDKIPLSCILLDIDHFKLYNDNYGHLKGDECLAIVAKTIRSILKRPADFVARYGGEEYVVLLPDTSLDGALRIAESIREEINGLQIAHETSERGILTLSQGVACLVPEQGQNEDLLIKKADRALYEAKDEGRNGVKAAAPG